MQDSRADWETEAQLTGRVYAACSLNIAALDAQNCHQGLFSHRNTLSFEPYQIVTSTGKTLYISHDALSLNGPERHGQNMALPGLLTRGWVLQEVLLSPRTLYYCADMLYWECKSCVASELDPTMRDGRCWRYPSTMGKSRFGEILTTSNESEKSTFRTATRTPAGPLSWPAILPCISPILQIATTHFQVWQTRCRAVADLWLRDCGQNIWRWT
jgi:hypothetical protein